MSNKEALPKAAFQFGVKMNDGRKTRKVAKTDKQEKQQLDKQWQQIQGIIEKRKAAGGVGAGYVKLNPQLVSSTILITCYSFLLQGTGTKDT
jgi:hypothetical protein